MKRFILQHLLPAGNDVIKCRHCGSTQVRPSHRSTGHTTHVTYRCQSCEQHFRVSTSGLGTRTVIISLAMLLLLVIGLVTVLFMDGSSEVEYRPKIDVSDTNALLKIEDAAKRGDRQAQYDLGWTYWQRDEPMKALPWIKAAADQGLAEAEYLLGVAYLNGRGTVQNYHSAFEQITKSAQHGHLEAQYQLGIFYRDGLGTPSNKESAYLWLNIAAARGHGDALQFRDKLAAVMSRAEIDRAQEASEATIAKLADASNGKPNPPPNE